jgi:hypothetical protein
MHTELDLDRISQELQLIPAWVRLRGETYGKRRNAQRISVWALDTSGLVASRDARRHIDWLLDRLEPRSAELLTYQQRGYELDLYCLWCRLGGSGGPMLSPQQMTRMAALGLTIGFEFWNADDEDEEPAVKPDE